MRRSAMYETDPSAVVSLATPPRREYGVGYSEQGALVPRCHVRQSLPLAPFDAKAHRQHHLRVRYLLS